LPKQNDKSPIKIYTANTMFKIESYTSIKELPVSIWNRFVTREAVNLEIDHLQAVETSGVNDIHPYYFIGYHDNEPVGIAYCFSMLIDITKLTVNYPTEVTAEHPALIEIRIVEVGHLASVGSTIEVQQPYLNDFLIAFSHKIDEIACLEKADLCIIRDIATSQYHNFKTLENLGFCPVMGFPIARMSLRWNNLEEYLTSLKAKKRNNIRQKRAKLLTPEITVEISEDYAPYSKRLAELWANVAQHSNSYEHEQLTPAYFEAMSRCLKGRSHVVAIKKQDQIVAYGLNLIGDEEYFGMAGGLDYDFRDEYDLYANNVFEALSVACKLGKKTFNIGITAYDFKTSIGAELDPCIYLIKAIKDPNYSAVYAGLIQKSIEQPTGNQHRAFGNTLSTI
jgi:8-amino-7-oxononanoate synthase